MGGLIAGWLNAGISIILPLLFFAYLFLRRRGQALAFFTGVATFLVAELLVVVPLFQWLAGPAILDQASNPVLYTLLLGLSAALLEGLARWLAFRFLLRKKRSAMDGIALGIGHGAMQTTVAALPYLLYCIFFPAVLRAESFADLFVLTPESLLTLAMQVCVTLLILRSVRECKPSLFALGVLAHALFRAVGTLSYLGLNNWLQLAILALLTAGLAFFVYQKRAALAIEPPSAQRDDQTKALQDPGSLDENIWK